MAECLEGLAQAAAAQDEPARAARLGGAAEAARAALGRGVFLADRAAHDRAVAAMRATLGEAGFARAWASGQRLSLAAAVAEALAPGDTVPAPR
jgi:hypothetical protein